jgi:hypothetical protein
MTKTYELTVSNINQIINKILTLPANCNLHLPDKPYSLSNLELISYLENRNLGLTFSVANHYFSGNFSLITDSLTLYLNTAQSNANIKELLIVSGPNNKKIGSLEALEFLKEYSEINESIKNKIISVAYNCNAINIEAENYKLVQKINSGLVRKVYIQITDNIEKIISGIKFIKSVNNNLSISVCIFEPSEFGLSKFKFRPWKGVILSDTFISSSKNAHLINTKNLNLLKNYDVESMHTIL